MAGKEGDKKPAAPAPKPAAPAAPKKPAESSFDLGAMKTASLRKPPPPVATGKVAVPPVKGPGMARPRGFDTMDSEVTVPGGAPLSLASLERITGSTSKDLKPVPEKMMTPFTSAQPVLVRPPTVFQKKMQASGFDDDEKTNTDIILGNAVGPELDADEEDEVTVTTALHDGLLPAREVTSVDTWKAVNAPMQSKPGRRTAILYQNVIDQFACGYNQRYVVEEGSGKSKTHIFVWDVTRAMNCEVPHFASGRETTLGQMVDWLRFEGHSRGWKKANAQQAAEAADRGEAVLALPQDGKSRLLAVVRPGGLDAENFPRVAAAIDEVGNDMPAHEALKTRLIAYYTHE